MGKLKESVLTIGNFDGMHRGHQKLIDEVCKRAKDLGLKSALITFDPHPVKVLYPEKGLRDLFSLEDRVQKAYKLGIDEVIVLPFSRDLSDLEPEEFFKNVILDRIHAKSLVVGYDFSFGRNRSGTHQVLRDLCKKYSVELHIEGVFKIEGEVVSSSKLRVLILNGEIQKASKFLGREFYLKGMIEKGDGRGKKIGFPTANLFTRSEFFPKEGVYASWIELKGGKYKSVTNVGKNPTFVDGKKAVLKVETHIFDFDEDIYGEKMTVHFLSRLRDEKKFKSSDELIQQIKLDVEKAKEYPWQKK